MFEDGFGLRQLAFAVGDHEAFLDAEIMNRQDVHASEFENQKHFNGPWANAFDLGETFDQFFVGQCENFVVSRNGTGNGTGGEVFDVGNFRARETDAAQNEIFDSEDLLGCGMRDVWKEIVETAHDGFGGAAAELLMGNRAQEGIERRAGFVRYEKDGAGRFDDAAKIGIDFGKMGGGFCCGFGEGSWGHFNSARRRGERTSAHPNLHRGGWWVRFFRSGLWRRFRG
jgi:hypothetical protein